MRARTTMHDGDLAYVALSWSDHKGPETFEDAYKRLVGTADYWHEWLAQTSGEKVAAPHAAGNDKYTEIEAAPGSYVKEKAPTS